MRDARSEGIHAWVLAVSAVAMFACGHSAPPERSTENASAAGGSLPVGTDSIVADRLHTVGQLDGPPEYAFGQIWAITPLPDGGFLVCDGNDTSLRRYDSTGVFLRAVGRKGAGPGEFVSCSDVAIDPRGRIVVSDPSNGRLAVFDSSGAFERVVAVSVSPGLGGGDNIFFIDPEGRYWKRGWLAGAAESEAAIPNQYVILDSNGVRLDSIPYPAAGPGPGRGFMLCTNDGCYVAQPVDTISAIGPDGAIAVAGPMRYHVSITRRGAATVEIARNADPVAYTDAEHAEWEAWRAYMAKREPRYPPIAIPKVKPLLRALRFDDVGRLWVKVHVTAERRPIPPRAAGDPRPLLTWRERNTFDLFDAASGDFIGRVAFPYATELLASRGDRVWLREEGEAGEQRIGIHRLRPASAARQP